VALTECNLAGFFDSASFKMTASYLAAVSAPLSRALRRLAAFLWMIPRLAALSIAEISERI